MSDLFYSKAICQTCHDIRTVTVRVEARKNDLRPCPACGNYSDEEYERFKLAEWNRRRTPPEICELDLTDEELKAFKMLRESHPEVSKLTVLSWLEAQRYDPSKDEEWLSTVARPAFREWMKGRKRKET